MKTEKQIAGRPSRRVGAPVGDVDLSTNDYLGLRNDPRVRAAAIRGIERYGVGSGGAREIAVGMGVVRELEARLASYKKVRAVRIVQSGYAANMGIVPTLVGSGDVVVLDRQSHRSSADGAALSGAVVVTYAHADAKALAEALRRARQDSAGKVLIITDGVFGLGGDIAPLPSIVEIAERYNAMVLVDDAHGSGVLGRGRGTVAHFGLTERVGVQVGTASKAMGVLGGYVAAQSEEVITRFSESRPVTHSTALPPHLAAACIASLDIMEAEPERFDRLWANRQRLADGLAAAGLDIDGSQTPIVPVITRDPASAATLGAKIRADGVIVSVLVPPKVAEADSRLRLIATSEHSPAQIEFAVAVIASAARSISRTAI